MADEKVTLLVDIEVNQEGAKKSLEEATRRIAVLNDEQQKLNKTIKETNKGRKGALKITEEQKIQLTAIKLALQREREEQKKYNKQVNTTSNSLNAMRSQLIANKKRLGDMDQSTRKGATSFRRLQKETDKLNTKISNQEKGYGVATRSVGGYEKAITNAQGVFPTLGSGIARVTSVMKAFTATLLVNPIFLIIAAVVALGFALSQFFTRTQKGVEKWEIIQATFNQTLDITLDRLAELGEAVFDFIELIGDDPLKALQKLGDAIKENMTNRIIGFVDILKSNAGFIADLFLIMGNKIKLALADVPILGESIDVEETEKRIEELTKSMEDNFKAMGESSVQALTGVDNLFGKIEDTVKGVNEEIKEEVALVIELTKQKQALEKEEVKFIITNQRRLKQIARFKLESENENNTIQERIKFLEKAIAIENKNLNDSIKLKERTIALGLINNGTIATQTEAISRVNQLLETGREIKISEIGLNTSTLEDQKKLNKSVSELDKLREASFIKQREQTSRLNELRRKGIAEEEEEEENVKVGTSEKSPLLAKLRKEFETEQKAAEKLRVFKAEQDIQDIDNLDEKLEAEKLLIQSQAQFRIDNEILTQSEIALINEKAAADQQALSERKAAADLEITKRTEQAKLQTASNALGVIAGLFEEGTAAYKVFATSQALIDTYTAANAAYASVVGIPIVGPVLAPVAAGTAVVAGLANVAKINGVQFEQGGLVKGNSHDQGGIQMYQRGTGQHLGEMEGNEYIVSAQRTREIGVDTLNSWNFGGVSPTSTGFFANGGQVSTSTQSASVIDQGERQTRQLIRFAETMPAPVVGVREIASGFAKVETKEALGL